MDKKAAYQLALLLCLYSSSASAIPVLDQVNELQQNANYNGTAPSLTWQQGVTSGASGLLSSIDLNFSGAGTIDFFINLGAPWQTDANDYQDMSLSVLSGWNNIDISSANIFLSSGDMFSIGLTGLNIGAPNPWGTAITDKYTGGAAFINGSLHADGSYDFNFRTYVDVGVVPVPAAVWLFGTALIGLVGFGKRKSRIVAEPVP